LTAIKVELGDKTVSLSSEIADRPWIIEQARKLTDEIWHSAAIVVDGLEPLIQELGWCPGSRYSAMILPAFRIADTANC
jgi:hypothetical protein